MANTTAVAVKKLQGMISGETFRSRVASFMGVPSQADKMINVLTTEIARNPKLAQCEPGSVLLAALRCARYNLEPGEGLACLIPRGGKCDFQLEYRGMLLLMHRTGQLKDIRCEVVHENDPVWEFEQGNQYENGYHLRHKRSWTGDRGEMIAVYAVARLMNGGEYAVAMDKLEVEHIRDKASLNTGPSSPWHESNWAAAMWRKTCLKQLAKVCPLSADIVSADRVDDLSMIGVDQPAPTGVDPAEIVEVARPTQESVATKVAELVESSPTAGFNPAPAPKPHPPESEDDRTRNVRTLVKGKFYERARARGWQGGDAKDWALEHCDQTKVSSMTTSDWDSCMDIPVYQEPAPAPTTEAEAAPLKNAFKPEGPPPFSPPRGDEPPF